VLLATDRTITMPSCKTRFKALGAVFWLGLAFVQFSHDAARMSAPKGGSTVADCTPQLIVAGSPCHQSAPAKAKRLVKVRTAKPTPVAEINRKEQAATKARLKFACCWGSLLEGVGVYVVEMPHREGRVVQQGIQYGLADNVQPVIAVTPNTTEGHHDQLIAQQVTSTSYNLDPTCEWSADRTGKLCLGRISCAVSHNGWRRC
jgi:hypothetical protein